MRELPVDENYYEKILNNFDQFCDDFEFAAAKRFSGVDNDSRQPVDNAEVQRLLQQLSERLTQLEKRISLLERPQLMYRPPKSETHQTIAQTLDNLHNDVDKLKDRI